MMNVLAKDLTWQKTRKLATVEASSLFGGNLPGLFNAYNGKTNKAATFVLHTDKTERDRDNSVVFWVYYPTRETLVKNPGLRDWKVLVFND